MQLAERRIPTTHVGSLPRPDEALAVVSAKDYGDVWDADVFDRVVTRSVEDVVRRQVATGLDIVNDGEQSKSTPIVYTRTRLAGFEPTEEPFGFAGQSRDARQFAAVYADQKAMYAARPHHRGREIRATTLACTSRIRYVGHAEVARDIARLQAALSGVEVTEAFMTAIAPVDVALYARNRFYATEEEYMVAIADAMREEYQAIVASGLVLQIDGPRLATHYDRTPELSLEETREFIRRYVAILNYALHGLPPERIRFHTCYSTNIAPRVHDLELRHFVDLMLQINAGAFSIEASNPRHEHEWRIWEDVALPDDRVLIPGVVSHCVTLVEHPELVAQRIERFAGVVGKERIIAANDCGFATAAGGDEVHPLVAWAKLEALVEGARLASQRLWPASSR